MSGATTTIVIIPQGLLHKLCARRIERSRADEADDGAEHEHVASPSSGGGGRPPLRRQPGPCLVLLVSSDHEHKNKLRKLREPTKP